MSRRARPHALRLALAIAAAVWLATLLWQALAQPLDEGYVRYAAVAEAMVTSGDWVVPHVGDRLYLDKPPLFPWAVALGRWAAGRPGGFATHAPNLLAALLLVVFVWRVAREVGGSRELAAAAAAIALLQQRSQVALLDQRLDLFFAALVTGALAHWLAATRGPARGRVAGPRRRVQAHAVLAGALLGAAVLTKGPVALLFFGGVALADALTEPVPRTPRRSAAWVGLLGFVAIALPWPVLLAERLGSEALRAGVESTRFATRVGGPLFYVFSLPVAWAPWSAFVPALVAALPLARQRLRDPAVRIPLLWLLVVLLPLHLTTAKHERYALPALAPFAILCAGLWCSAPARERRLPPAARRLRNATLYGLLLLAGLAGLGLLAGSAALGQAGPVVATLAVVACLLCVLALRPDSEPRARLALAVAVLLLGLSGWNAFRAARFESRPCLEQAARKLAALPPDAPLATYALDETRRLDARFAAGRRLEPLQRPHHLIQWLRHHPEAHAGYVLTSPRQAAVVEQDPLLRVDELQPLCLRRLPRVLLRVTRAPGRRR